MYDEITSSQKIIQLNYPDLTKSERRLADYIMDHFSAVSMMPLSELADKTDASEPTVMRFVRKIGFEGYSDFKRRLLRDNSISPTIQAVDESERLDTDTPIGQLPRTIIGITIGAMKDTVNLIDTEAFQEVVRLILKARMVDVYGVGFSGEVANELMVNLVRIGIDCRALSDKSMHQIGSFTPQKGDLAIGISHSGLTINTVNALKNAKEHGVHTVAITGYKSSELNRYADISLLTGEVNSPLAAHTMVSKVLQTMVINALYMGVLLSDYPNYSSNYEVTQKRLAENDPWRRRMHDR